jgi:WD40 repeat protein
MESNNKLYSEVYSIEAHSDTVFDLAILKNGNIISASRDSFLKIWDSKDYKLISSIKTTHQGIRSIAVMQNGTLASTGNNYKDKQICLRDPENNFEVFKTFEMNDGFGVYLRAMNDGGLVCGSSFPDRKLYIFNESFEQRKTNYSHIADINCITESAEGNLYVSSDKRVVLISKEDQIEYLDLNGTVSGIILLNSDKLIVSSTEGTLEISQSGKNNLYRENLSSGIYRLIQLSENEFATGHKNGALMIWEYLQEEKKFVLIQSIESISEPIRSLLLNGQDIIVGYSNGEIKVWRKNVS